MSCPGTGKPAFGLATGRTVQAQLENGNDPPAAGPSVLLSFLRADPDRSSGRNRREIVTRSLPPAYSSLRNSTDENFGKSPVNPQKGFI